MYARNCEPIQRSCQTLGSYESETNWQINPIKIKRKDAIEESPERTLGNAFDNYVDEDANQGYNYENSNQGSPCESP